MKRARLKNWQYLSGLFCVLIWSSCNILDPSEEEYLPVEGNICFKLWERYPSWDLKEPPKIQIRLQTEKQYPHTGFDIIATMITHGNTINIKIDGIKNWNAGGDAISSAYWETFLDLSNGTYYLSVTNLHKMRAVDSYTIIVNENSIKIEKKNQRFTIPEYALYWRYPKNSFAYTCKTLKKDSLLCYNFIDSLKKTIKLEPIHFPDDGINPYFTQSLPGRHYHHKNLYFHYFNESDYLKARDFLIDYTQNVIPNYEWVSISLVSWDNVTYKSSMYD